MAVGQTVRLKRAAEDRKGWRHREMMSETCCRAQDYTEYWLTLVKVYKRIYVRRFASKKKTGPIVSRLSRSLKLIGTDTDRSATYDFLLTFHSNRGHILYRFRDCRARYWLPKTTDFFPHGKCVTALQLENRMMGLPSRPMVSVCLSHYLLLCSKQAKRRAVKKKLNAE